MRCAQAVTLSQFRYIQIQAATTAPMMATATRSLRFITSAALPRVAPPLEAALKTVARFFVALMAVMAVLRVLKAVTAVRTPLARAMNNSLCSAANWTAFSALGRISSKITRPLSMASVRYGIALSASFSRYGSSFKPAFVRKLWKRLVSF